MASRKSPESLQKVSRKFPDLDPDLAPQKPPNFGFNSISRNFHASRKSKRKPMWRQSVEKKSERPYDFCVYVYSFHFIAFWQGKATADLRLFSFRRGHCSRAQNAKTTSRPRESAFASRYTELLANPRFHYPAVATARPTRGPRVRRGCSSPNPTPRVPPRARSTCTRQAPRMS